jgi:peptidoglycan/xylan/chitin deacetylase (PgdA/CDA1 family)
MILKNTVVNFHVIRNPEWMENILKLLLRHFNMVSAEELENFYHHGYQLKNSCHITVDDGDLSVFTHLFPLIKKYNIPISIYVSPLAVKTGRNFWFQEIKDFDYRKLLQFYNEQNSKKIPYVGPRQVSGIFKSMKVNEVNSLIEAFKKKYDIPDKKRIGMNLDQILELKDSGLVAIGAHTLNHPILKNEDDPTSRKEILDSIWDLSDMLNEKVKYFAYPNGNPDLDFGEREINFLKEGQVKLAFSTNSKSFSRNDDALTIPRRGITKGGNAFVFAKLAMGDYWEIIRKLVKSDLEPDFRSK